jgi:outer membrane protein assembly factor BamB
LPQDTPYETCAPWPHFGGLYNTNSRLTPLKGPSPTAAPTNSWSCIINSEFYCSPVIGQNGTIYVSSGSENVDNGNVYAINPDGTIKWSYSTSGFLYGSCAIGKDGTIYVAAIIPYGEIGTGAVYALNPADGSLKWLFTGFPTNGATVASPTIGIDGTIYIASLDNYLYAINPDGTFKWASPSAGNSYYLVCPAIGQDGTIYAGATDGLRAFNPVDGSIKWGIGLGALSSPAIGPDGSIYISDSDNQQFIKCDQDGNIIWQVQMFSYTLYLPEVSSPAIDSNGIIYLANTTIDSTGYIIAINPLDGSTIWQTDYPDPFLSSVTIDGNGTLFAVSGGGKVLALNSTNGTELWSINTVGSPWSSPSIGQNNTLYISLFEGISALF